ncbi:ParA family protein [Phreatobacter sp. AB_2022a]|uniref:ParA family protein n=1 Tax=Phreatobacter sp. AB_2022a TaxID=3003134 RepID=UPI0022874E91|nr:hypothetical protein [Phreatobacter sp. AB_2022a]MCZ0737715.1 hypothetical protein [Phreatobacter sp. AB_2022a]
MTHYDEALPKFAALVQELLGPEEMLEHVFLRDAYGKLTFIILKSLDATIISRLREQAAELSPWVDAENPVADPGDLFDATLSDPEAGYLEWVDSPGTYYGFVRVIERRIVGQDWLRPPQEPIVEAPPVVVFASHKGGVGRSTALAVSAAALSRAGFNILVIDLDLEAPGLGEMLLKEPPRFGTLDFFIESGVSEIEDSFFDDLVVPSQLADLGLVHVAPAVGSEGNASPQNILGKIARAYVEKSDVNGTVISFLDRTRELVRRLCERNRYDAVFIDARAGLNEATAGAILGLGAEILLFGVDTPQTFAGYRYFLAHLQRFRPEASGDNDWRYRLRMVQAKAQADPKTQANFRTNTYEMFSDTIYDAEEGIEEEAFNFDYEDVSAPHYAWPILGDSNYAEFDPIAKVDQFSSHMYDRTFGPFIEALRTKIGLKA